MPLWVHPEWAERFPWLVQGTTGRGTPEEPFELSLSSRQPVGVVLARWRQLQRATGLPAAVHARQQHGAELWVHALPPAPGLLVLDGRDGHLTAQPGLLLSVSIADCVPVFLVSPAPRAIALLHAGWRGTAARILAAGCAALQADAGIAPGELWMHCGPAICGACYEVGPEVHAALRPDRPAPLAPSPVDVRQVLVEQALALEIAAERISVSSHCTRCGPPDFFSHRGGDPERQMGVLGMR